MDQVEKALIERYGDIKPKRLSGGFTHSAYLLEGTEPALVAKVASLANMDIQNEINSLQFLKNMPFAPKVMDHFSVGNTQIMISTFEQGTNGQSVLDTGDLERSERLFKEMGVCLARNIHSQPYKDDRNNLRIGSFDQLRFDLDFVPKELRVKSQALLRKLNTQSEEWVLTHGDFGSHNILVKDNGGITVIDWEWTEWFHPLVDLAWTCWNTKLHYPEIGDRLNLAFITSYQSCCPINITPELITAYSLYKLWSILLKIKAVDHGTQEKWLNRLEWTLKTVII